jgi:isopropylmalate/homocitrate/citramalate synthase
MSEREVRIYEVGPRDGLQAEPEILSTDAKLRFIELLGAAGLREIEATSFVSSKAIPQLADADELMRRLPRMPGVRYPVLVPNERGMQRALEASVDAICLFTAATESYARHNINMSVAGSLAAFAPVAAAARQRAMWIRGYVSTAFGCPYEGEVDEAAVVAVCQHLLDLGVDQLSISDTVGVAAPRDVRRVLGALLAAGIDTTRLGCHFHDTRGTALANVMAAMELGIRCFDASAGGIGGSPYAPGAAGNLATEDLVYLLDREGITHGVSLDAILEAARFVNEQLHRSTSSKVGRSGGWPASATMQP